MARSTENERQEWDVWQVWTDYLDGTHEVMMAAYDHVIAGRASFAQAQKLKQDMDTERQSIHTLLFGVPSNLF